MNIVWLQSGGCGGCTLSLLNAENPDLLARLRIAGLELLWHPSLSEASADEVLDLLADLESGRQQLDIFCVEGSIVRGPNGSGRFHILAGTGRPFMHWAQALATQAKYTVAVGTCAAFGGITAAGSNPSEACGLQYDGAQLGGLLGADYRSGAGLPVINIAGCPTHPNWVLDNLALIAAGEMHATQLDTYARPRSYTDLLAHHGCPRNEFYEYKASATQQGEQGCLMEFLGCLGTQAHADCNTRLWNGEGSCTRGGYACINCTAPEFEEPGHTFLQTPHIAGIPIGLPTDMPKAWFVALASLSKAATPERLRKNAVAEQIVIPPTIRKPK